MHRGAWWVTIHEVTSLMAQVVENLPHCRRCRFNHWVRKILWRRKWQPTPVFLPGDFNGQRSLAGYSPWCHKESDTTKHTSTKQNKVHHHNQKKKLVLSHPVVYNSLWPHGLQPSRLLCPRVSLGKNTEVGCHFLLPGKNLGAQKLGDFHKFTEIGISKVMSQLREFINIPNSSRRRHTELQRL